MIRKHPLDTVRPTGSMGGMDIDGCGAWLAIVRTAVAKHVEGAS